jgi:FtsP/CotA-like multicopper oxidase with cupredoxin domain
MAVGERFSARVSFPDPGVYWYHPHIREDYGQEMGLYGNVLVEPADPDYWPPAHRDVALTLDDILLEDGLVAPFKRAETNYAAMGRFGDVLLVGGETELSLDARLGEVVRLYLTNTANTRVFKVALPGARMKLVGGDSGHVEREELVDDVVLAPSERVIVDVLFDQPGRLTLEHRTPDRVYPLAAIEVSEERAEPSLERQFEVLRTNADMVAERERLAEHLEAAPDRTLAFIAEMDMPTAEGEGPVTYTCPMHPEVVSEQPGHCPDCGMKLLPAQLVAEAGGGHSHEGHHEHHDQVESFVFKSDMPFDGQKLEQFLSGMIQVYGPDLLRYKGVLWMKGNPRRVVFQGVHMMMGGDMGKPWAKNEKKHSVMVFIGKKLPKDIFIAGMEECLAK